jgi:hypothetical protein
MRTVIAAIASVALLSAQPEQLFNGKDLTGWQMVGAGRFVVENGMMKTEGGMGLLWYTGRKIGNETVRVTFKTTGDRDNSGVIIRMPDAPTDAWYGVHNGYEIQIDAAGPDEWHQTGSIYSLSKAEKKTQKPVGEWNTMEIQLDGQLTRISLNGVVVNELRGDQKVPARKLWYEPVRGSRPDFGFIGLQNHDPRTAVYFREVTVLATYKSPQPMTQGERDRLLSYLHSTRKQLVDATANLTQAQWSFKPGPEKWSVAELVEHLALTEDLLFGYVRQFIDRPVPPPAAGTIKTEQVVENMTNRSKPANAPAELRPAGKWPAGPILVDEFKQRRDRLIQWVNETKDPVRTLHARWGGITLEVYQAVFTIPGHTERHLAQIQEVKANAGFPKQP